MVPMLLVAAIVLPLWGNHPACAHYTGRSELQSKEEAEYPKTLALTLTLTLTLPLTPLTLILTLTLTLTATP